MICRSRATLRLGFAGGGTELSLRLTGTSRKSARIIAGRTWGIEAADDTTMHSLHRIKAYTGQMKEDLLKGRINLMAEVMNEAWREKRRTAQSVSNSRTDFLDEMAAQAGALGSKIPGAGAAGS